jgi:cold shock CspA family protein
MEKEGTIIFFDPFKGFGQIISMDSERVFVHISDLRDQVYEGDKVTFVYESKDAGKPVARAVRKQVSVT